MFKEDDGCYWVLNIVFLKLGDLGMKGYNDVLLVFVEVVVQLVVDVFGFVYEYIFGSQLIEDWISEDMGKVLKVFFVVVNKFMGCSYLMDEW